MNVKIAFVAVVVMAFCMSLSTVHGKRGRHIDNFFLNNRAPRVCSEVFGCRNNRCWAYCGIFTLKSGLWCYTTKSEPRTKKYVECTSDAQCDPCWKCSELCHL